MASSILTMCVAAYFYLQTIVYFQTYMSALLILIPVTSTLFCQNTVGSHTCSCKAGYGGNGNTCQES